MTEVLTNCGVTGDILPREFFAGKVISRRRLITIALATGSAGLIAACNRGQNVPVSSTEPQTGLAPAVSVIPNEYNLAQEGDKLIDQYLGKSQHQHPYLEYIGFSFDESRNRSLKMDSQIGKEVEQRLYTREEKPNKGDIYCMPHVISPGLLVQYPVIRFAPEDVEVTHLGFRSAGEPCERGYQGMRAYELSWSSEGKLVGKFVSVRDIDPQKLKPRDKEAENNYWNLGCNLT
jgi:hypothetical protein